MAIELSLSRAKELLAEAVALKGENYVYTTEDGLTATGDVQCLYVHGDQPGCIVGHVLHAAGVSLDELAEWEGRGALTPVSHLLNAEAGVARLLDRVQQAQDRGRPWGAAVREALAELEY